MQLVLEKVFDFPTAAVKKLKFSVDATILIVSLLTRFRFHGNVSSPQYNLKRGEKSPHLITIKKLNRAHKKADLAIFQKV